MVRFHGQDGTTQKLGIVCAQLGTYPQAPVFPKSYTQSGYIREAHLPTPINLAQVLDKKGENATVHR